MELRPGSEISAYTAIRRLGGGGMGVVWLVRHRERGTHHAVKLLRHVDPRLAVRLRAEGLLQGSLDHPNVVGLTEIIEVQGQPGLVMEYVAGPTLDGLLTAVRELSIPEVDALGRSLLRAVAAAHARGWIHRDLKPGNVLLHLDGDRIVPRVTDFGLAAALGEAEIGTMTRHGAGTRRYMSLEQLTGTSPEPSMDVFALGALLFELLDGTPAFPTVHGWKDALRSGRYPEPVRTDVPVRMRDAIRCALTDRITREPDAAALLRRWEAGVAEGEHPFSADTLAIAALASAHVDPDQDRPGDEAHLALCPSCRSARHQPESWTWGSPDALMERHNIPAERDGFVGREADLAAIAERLAVHRLVTVHGPGGIGKTRLALRFGRRERGHWPGGVWLCDLSEARDVDAIVRAVARALGVLLGGSDPVVQLGHAMAGRGRCLVVLDDFERAVDHAAATVSAWSERAPEAAFLATSRIVLGIRGEQVLRIEPLGEADAIALFVQRATAASASFDPAADTEGVRRLVGLLDGLPLAIELCAARVRMMSPARIVERMDDRFKVLSGGRGRPDRHATLRAVLDASWDLLEDWQRGALAQCSVFAGGFDLAAVEHVLDLSAFPDAPWPMDVLQSLVDASLVRSVGDGRFDLLVSIREYGAEKLGDDDRSVRLQHASWYAELADATEARDRPLNTEVENLVAAARAALDAGQGSLAARAALGAARVLVDRGPFQSGHALLCEVRDRPELADLERARVDVAVGRLAQAMGRSDEGRDCLDRALTTFRAMGEERHEAATLQAVGTVEWESGRTAEARLAFDRALALHRAHGDRAREGRALNALTTIAVEEGSEDAGEKYEDVLRLAREAGLRIDEAIALANIANLHALKGRHAQAISVYEEALALHRETANRKQEGRLLGHLGNLHLMVGQLDQARACIEAATRVFREVGDRRGEGIVLSALGPLRFLQGRTVEAEELLNAALVVNRETGNRRTEAYVLANLAIVHARTERYDGAVALFHDTLAVYRDIGNRISEGIVLGLLAECQLDRGALAEAQAALAEAAPLVEGVGDLYQIGILACVEALIRMEAGDPVAARASFERAQRLARELGSAPGSTFGRVLDRATKALAKA